MPTPTARSRRASRENSLWRRAPRWLRGVVIGFLALILVDALVVGGWLIHSGGLGNVQLFGAQPQRVYLPLMVSNPTTDPMLARKPTSTPTFQFSKYEIRYGDTLYDIAQAHKISLEFLLAVNPGLERSTILYPGDIILIPPPGMTIADIPPTPTPTRKPTKTPTPGQGAGEMSATGTQSAALDATPTRKPPPALVERVTEINGVPIEKVIVLPPEVVDNIQRIFANGQEKGRNAHAFSKIGDSTIESPFFMDRFDSGPYNLGEYIYLQKVINFFKGSFARQGPAVQRGMHAWSLFDPMWTNYEQCNSGESPVECELRIQNSAFVFVRLGSNDAGRTDLFTSGMKQLVELCLRKGVIPILGTKADRIEGDNENNQIIRKLAEEYDVPLWDFDKVAQTLPNNGIGDDGVHLTIFYPHDYTLPEALQTGYGVHTLTALMMLYELWRMLVRS